MKKNKAAVAAVFLIFAVGAIGLVACSHKDPSGGGMEKGGDGAISYYTCPMHPHVHENKPGNCPICGMTLVPVYKEAAPPAGAPGSGPSATISSERQQLIGIKTEPAQKKQVVKEIRTVGRVAFDPELAIAQQEFVEIAKNVPSLKPAAVSRLKLLGMSDEEIRDLGKKGKAPSNLYLPAAGDSVWIYATLYQNEADIVKIGDKAIITLPMNQARRAVEGEALSGFARGGGDASPYEGTVRAVDPVINPMTHSARARIEVPKAGGILRPDSYVNVSLKIDLGEAITIPKSAVIDTGTRRVAFVVHEDTHFQSRDIKIGPEADNDEVVILDGIQEGEKVVSSAAFLVDSESQLKAAVSGTAPSCPAGQAWDTGMSMCMPKAGS